MHRFHREETDAIENLLADVIGSFESETIRRLARGDLAARVRSICGEKLVANGITLNRLEQRSLVTKIVNQILAQSEVSCTPQLGDAEFASNAEHKHSFDNIEHEIITAESLEKNDPEEVDLLAIETIVDDSFSETSLVNNPIEDAKSRVQPVLLERIDVATATQMSRGDLARQVTEIVGEILFEERIRLNLAEQRDLVTMLINDMLGLGPLEPLLDDESVTDIMVNGPDQVYVERKGKLVLADIKFRDNQHVMNIATRIVSKIGRRVDETSPLVDARLEDGSRVNIIIPPLAIDGASISIRKFSKKGITLDVMASQKNISNDMATVL